MATLRLSEMIKWMVPWGLLSLREKYIKNKLLDAAWDRFGKSDCEGIIKSNKRFYKQGNGRRAFVIATGPSLKRQDLSILEGEDCFTVSNAFLHPLIHKIKPKYHFFAPYHPPLIRDNFAAWLRKADETLPEGTEMFLSFKDRDIVSSYGLFNKRTVNYLFFNALLGRLNKDYDISWPIDLFQTGPQMIIPVLFYMNYSEIYLLGCDHNSLQYFKCSRENFYTPDKDIRINAVGPQVWRSIDLELESQLKIFRIYRSFKEYADRKNIRLINLSPRSWLDFFESADLELVGRKNTNMVH